MEQNQNRDEGRRVEVRVIRRYEAPPDVPDQEVDGIASEELSEHSPDGRPADRPSRSIGLWVLLVCMILSIVPVALLVWWLGGQGALLLAVVYVLIMVLSAFPAWYAGLMRHREEREAHQIVRQVLSSERFGSNPAPR